jgi:hypothetical protein
MVSGPANVCHIVCFLLQCFTPRSAPERRRIERAYASTNFSMQTPKYLVTYYYRYHKIVYCVQFEGLRLETNNFVS